MRPTNQSPNRHQKNPKTPKPKTKTTALSPRIQKKVQALEATAVPKTSSNPLQKIRSKVFKRPAIQSIVREPTAGGIIFRVTPDQKDIEILLIQDSKNRWTIPKGHVEPGETAKQTAIREINEETGLKKIKLSSWLTTQIYLVHSLDPKETPVKEKWMNDIKWFRFSDALDVIEYEDIEKLMLIAKKRIRSVEV